MLKREGREWWERLHALPPLPTLAPFPSVDIQCLPVDIQRVPVFQQQGAIE